MTPFEKGFYQQLEKRADGENAGVTSWFNPKSYIPQPEHDVGIMDSGWAGAKSFWEDITEGKVKSVSEAIHSGKKALGVAKTGYKPEHVDLYLKYQPAIDTFSAIKDHFSDNWGKYLLGLGLLGAGTYMMPGSNKKQEKFDGQSNPHISGTKQHYYEYKPY